MNENQEMPDIVTLGMFIVDTFSFLDDGGRPTEEARAAQIGGGGTYAAIGARVWLPASKIGMVIDKGYDFPASIYAKLLEYGPEMWMFRDQTDRPTTRALNTYLGDHRSFEYITPRIRLTPRILHGTKFARPRMLHFICSPTRASAIISEVREVEGWTPTIIYEPIPARCVPEQLPALIKVLPSISILSPNAEEALSLLSLSLSYPPSKALIEQATQKFLDIGVGHEGQGCVIIRSGALGAYVKVRERKGAWIDAFWNHTNAEKIIDVTGAGNSFLGGLAAGLSLIGGDVYEAVFYASVSASFTIEQEGLPKLSLAQSEDGQPSPQWNGDLPQRRLIELRGRQKK